MTPTPHDYQTLSLSLVLMGVLMVPLIIGLAAVVVALIGYLLYRRRRGGGGA